MLIYYEINQKVIVKLSVLILLGMIRQTGVYPVNGVVLLLSAETQCSSSHRTSRVNAQLSLLRKIITQQILLQNLPDI